MTLHTCVRPPGFFIIGIHKPTFTVSNYRHNDYISALGRLDDEPYLNQRNFPSGPVQESNADWIYEIPNPFSFRGTTFIKRQWADRNARHPDKICLPTPKKSSMSDFLATIIKDADSKSLDQAFINLPENVLLALAVNSSDPLDLMRLAKMACDFIFDPENNSPCGLIYHKDSTDQARAKINNMALFESVVNNPNLPDDYKRAMVLRPGVQGASEIVGEYGTDSDQTHVFEYLRRNSYIPWGHYAANMADDAIRYQLADLSPDDMQGLRHIYYQRTFLRLAEDLDIQTPPPRDLIPPAELENLRQQIVTKLTDPEITADLKFTTTLWGWNYGFDFAPSHYRLHASHQQIHQQFAMLPDKVEAYCGQAPPPEDQIKSYGCGDLIQSFIKDYRQQYKSRFFADYIAAIRNNTRVDGNPDGPASLIIYEDKHIMLFVPKAQTSQWEVQLMTIAPIGNIIEADITTRTAIDKAISLAMGIFAALNARMVTSIEFPKRLAAQENDQRLLYSFLPKLPESMGAFSEAQLRWINGHYPEDFAYACRKKIGGGK